MQKLETNSKKTNFGKKIILIIAFIILIFFAIYYNQNLFTELSNTFIKDAAIIEKEEVVQEQEAQEEVSTIIKNSNTQSFVSPKSTYYVKVEESLPDMASDDNKKVRVKFYEAVRAYRDYLLNVNLLIVNFFQDKIYTDELRLLKTLEFPEKIDKILINFDNYNKNYLINKNYCAHEKIFPKILLIERFIKVEQVSECFKDKEALKSQLIKDINIFIDFFHSKKIQQKFIE